MPEPAASKNSTNVRRMIALALALWGIAVIDGWHDGVFAKLADGELAALALFAFAFASASYFLDRNLRAMEISWGAMAAALGTAAIAVGLSTAFARDVAWLFAGPVLAAVLAAAIDRALRRRVTSSRPTIFAHRARHPR